MGADKMGKSVKFGAAGIHHQGIGSDTHHKGILQVCKITSFLVIIVLCKDVIHSALKR